MHRDNRRRPTRSRIQATLQKRVGGGFDGVIRYLFPFVSSTIAVVTGFLIIIFLAIYIAVDPEMYRRGIMHLFPYDHRERAGEVLSAIAAVLRKWLVTQLIAMLTISIVVTVVLARHARARPPSRSDCSPACSSSFRRSVRS